MDFAEIPAQPTHRLSNIGSKDPVILTSTASLISTGSADSQVSDKKRKEKIAEFKKNVKDLQQMLNQKIEELKSICLREAELTGKIPKEYPLEADEKVPEVPRCIRVPFRLKDPAACDKDPLFWDLESKFALQQQIVSEGDLYRTVKSKRRDDYMNAVKNQEERDKPMNGQKTTKARKVPKMVPLLIPTDDVHSSEFSSQSQSLSPDDDYEQFGTAQYSTILHHAKTLHIPPIKDRRASANDLLTDSRLNPSNYKSLHYCQTDAKSSCSTRSRPTSSRTHDSHIIPPTPLPSYSSTQLRLENNPQSFRQCSGSLESLSQIRMETKNATPSNAIFPAQRSSSTEILDDRSSYTSQSSVEYHAPAGCTHRRGHRKDLYRNTGSMPNLVESEPSYHQYHPHTAYDVTGYAKYGNIEPYSAYGGESERYYDFYPPYHLTQGPHHRDNMHSPYADNVSYNPYASVGPIGNRFTAHSGMQQSKCIQKALVAEHLKGWFQRNTTQRQGTHNYDYNRIPKQSQKSQNSAVVYAYNNRNIPCSTVSYASSNGNWNAYRSDGPSLDVPDSYLYHAASNHSRSYMDVSHSSHMHSPTTQGGQICWHEDSVPGTIV